MAANPLEEKLHIRALKLWSESLLPSDRVLITGASGWFGQTALALCSLSGVDTFAVSRSPLATFNSEITTGDWEENRIQKFKPTVIIDCAFQTREKLSIIPLADYVKQNSLLTERMLWLASLDTVRLAMTISSGAAVHPHDAVNEPIEKNPYGFMKRKAEQKLSLLGNKTGISTVIPRAWSVSGAFCPKPELFAFTDLISQATTGRILIKSSTKVYRRYTSVEDLLSVSLASARLGSSSIIDSGGELFEIEELAEKIRTLVSPNATISRANSLYKETDNYFPSGTTWIRNCESADFLAEDLESQILKVANTINN